MEIDNNSAIILIVEDDLVLGRVLARVLRNETRRTLRVGESQLALDLVQTYRPQLVLLDTQLRDGTAAKLFEALSEQHPTLPIILLAAHRPDRSYLRERVHRAVTKSVGLRELREIVDAALGAQAVRGRREAPDPDRILEPLNLTQLSLHAPSTNR
jgi:two-component system response regulator GlrR